MGIDLSDISLINISLMLWLVQFGLISKIKTA